MQVYLTGNTRQSPGEYVVVFGCGLIGGKVLRDLQRRGARLVCQQTSRWNSTAEFKDDCRALGSMLEQWHNENDLKVHFLWCAGSGSFASTAETLRSESEAFQLVWELFASLSHFSRGSFHYISSAGGLFEGQLLVGRESQPMPLRPYGEMKLQQERLLSNACATDQFNVHIYRPSTVYGARRIKKRAGLISHLVWNALLQLPTILESRTSALRDYIYVDDVSRFIVNTLLDTEHQDMKVHHLVSGKPSSIFEVSRKVQALFGRSIIFHYSSKQKNDANITFRSNLKPMGWKPMDLENGLRIVLADTRNYRKQDNVALSGR